MSSMDRLASELKKSLSESDKRKPKPYDTTAEVLRVENDVVWVHIPGGIDETPVRRTVNAKKGDNVQLRVANGSAWIVGNDSRPPTDDAEALVAKEIAIVANTTSEAALADAGRAKMAADEAEAQAVIAKNAADGAVATAESVRNIANQAQTDADRAEASANSASVSANTALSNLSVIENVVGVLDLVSKHGQYQVTKDLQVIPGKWYFKRLGTYPNYEYQVVSNPTQIEYELTTDTDVDPNKTYYERSGSGTQQDPYVYTEVENPSGSPVSQTWYECIYYELVEINKAIENYVSSKLAVDKDGLWLQTDGMQTKVLLSARDGVVLYGTDGKIVGKYGATARIGDGNGFHIDIGVWYELTTDNVVDPNKSYYSQSGLSPDYIYTKVDNPSGSPVLQNWYEQRPPELGFYDGTKKVAYISNEKLYITQSVVLRQMDVGEMVADGGKGQWSWKVHEVNGSNNLYLKWLG